MPLIIRVTVGSVPSLPLIATPDDLGSISDDASFTQAMTESIVEQQGNAFDSADYLAGMQRAAPDNAAASDSVSIDLTTPGAGWGFTPWGTGAFGA